MDVKVMSNSLPVLGCGCWAITMMSCWSQAYKDGVRNIPALMEAQAAKKAKKLLREKAKAAKSKSKKKVR